VLKYLERGGVIVCVSRGKNSNSIISRTQLHRSCK